MLTTVNRKGVALFALLIALLTISLTVILVQRQQDLRSKAADSNPNLIANHDFSSGISPWQIYSKGGPERFIPLNPNEVDKESEFTIVNSETNSTEPATQSGINKVTETDSSTVANFDKAELVNQLVEVVEVTAIVKVTPVPTPKSNNASLTNDFGVGKVTIFFPGIEGQLYQPGIKVKPDTEYSLSFRAKANREVFMPVQLLEQASPFSEYGLNTTVKLTTNWEKFGSTFKTLSSVDGGARLSFMFAQTNRAGDQYYIDDVILKEVIEKQEVEKPTLVFSTISAGTLALDEKTKYDSIINDEYVKSVTVLNGNISKISEASSIEVLTPNEKNNVVLTKNEIKSNQGPESNATIWKGSVENSDTTSTSTIVLYEGVMSGYVNTGKNTYSIRSIGDNQMVLIETDASKLPENIDYVESSSQSSLETSVTPQTISVLIPYTGSVLEYYDNDSRLIGAEALNRIEYINDAFLTSGISHRLELSSIMKIDNVETVEKGTGGYVCGKSFDNLLSNKTAKSIREAKKVDIVMAMMSYPSDNCDFAGIAGAFNGSIDYASIKGFSMYFIEVGSYSNVVFAHEVGHVLGGGHEDGSSHFPYSHAMIFEGEDKTPACTIMTASPSSCYVNFFSSPLLPYCAPDGCGTPEYNDNVRAINEGGMSVALYGENLSVETYCDKPCWNDPDYCQTLDSLAYCKSVWNWSEWHSISDLLRGVGEGLTTSFDAVVTPSDYDFQYVVRGGVLWQRSHTPGSDSWTEWFDATNNILNVSFGGDVGSGLITGYSRSYSKSGLLTQYLARQGKVYSRPSVGIWGRVGDVVFDGTGGEYIWSLSSSMHPDGYMQQILARGGDIYERHNAAGFLQSKTDWSNWENTTSQYDYCTNCGEDFVYSFSAKINPGSVAGEMDSYVQYAIRTGKGFFRVAMPLYKTCRNTLNPESESCVTN